MSAVRWHYVNRYTPNCGAGKAGIAWTITDRPAHWRDGSLEAVDGSDLVCIADTRDVRDESVARLIAAAPDLLEAARAYLDASPAPSSRKATVAWDALRSAIAKATGGAS